jgi:MYXO-CTERM domain-containing protein
VNSSTKFTDTAGTLIVNGTVGDVALAGTGILGGSGTAGDVTTVSGSVISPGNSPDTLTFTNWAPAGGTIIDWEVLNAGPSRVAGTDYDTIRVTGNLDLAGVTSINRIMIKVTSLDTISTDGPALNFNSPDAEGMMPRTFTLMTIEGSILNQSGSISDLFAFDFNDFDHTNLGAVNPNYWSVSSFEVGGDTQLIITAVPEPSTYGFGLGALALAAAAIRRRRKLKAEKKA